jgi:glutaredoxin
VQGEKKNHKIKCYTVSTCVWCKKTKKWLKDNSYEYEYIDVDLLEGEDKQKIQDEVRALNDRVSFPTIVIDDTVVIVGHDSDKLKEALEND